MNTPTTPPARRSDLDALRAGAMLLGIVLHASLSFFPSFWIVTDSRQDPALGVVFSAIHGFRMPLFFVMSGFFSAMLLARRGRGALVKHRFRRVFLPLLAGMVTVVPATNWISGVAMTTAAKAARPAPSTVSKASLWTSAEAGDVGAIERHLAGGAAVDGEGGGRGWTPLLHAALADRAEAVELLLRRGAQVDRRSEDGGTALHAAAFVGSEKAAAALVAHGADVNAVNNRGATPLNNALVDEGTTRYFASLLDLPLKEDGLGPRKAAVAEALRRKGGIEGRTEGLADLLMQWPLFNHLWFLWFLWWLVLGLAAASAVAARLPGLRLPAWAVRSPARYVWLVPLTMIPQWFMGDGGTSPIFGPDTSAGLLPIPHVFAYYAIFFGFGALDFDDRAGRVGGRWWLPLAVGLLAVFPLGLALTTGWAGPAGVTIGPEARRALVVVLQAAYPWFLTFGLMGLARRFCPAESPTVRYLSDSAYWLYLAHLPLVIGAQYLVKDWPLPALAKLTLIMAAVGGLLLLSYQLLVRHTWIGRFLNGPRARPVPVAEPATAA